MSADADTAAWRPNGNRDDDESIVEEPVTPPEHDTLVAVSSQATLPSTEAPGSPMDSTQPFKTENNDDRLTASSAAVIPSSLTPPPSSQVHAHNSNKNGALHGAYLGSQSQRSTLFSPPATGIISVERDGALAAEYAPPAPHEVLEASADELRAMMQTCIAEHAKLKMEAAHYKLQYNLLSMQADEDAKRADVELEMIRREVDALRSGEQSQQARREASVATESAQMKYLQMKMLYEETLDENDALAHRFKSAKKLVSQKEEEVSGLMEERDMLLNRIRENREHFHMLCSPGGMFHGVLTPRDREREKERDRTLSTPQQGRVASRYAAPRHDRDARGDRGQEPMVALLQALSQDNSAPSTPVPSYRPAPRHPSKHTRNAQSLSSLPTTPASKPRGEHASLLPSADLLPQSEPPQRHHRNSQTMPGTGPSSHRQRGRKSRESTISAGDDNEELARQALQSVAKGDSLPSRGSAGAARGSRRPLPSNDDDDDGDDEVMESQASQAASDMLRRDPRESFEVASSVGSRDGTPGPVEKSAKLQSKLLSGITKNATTAEKRKLSGGLPHPEDLRQGHSSPAHKRMRVGSQPGDHSRVGLGIQYGHA